MSASLKKNQYRTNSKQLEKELHKFQSQPSFGKRRSSSNHSSIPQLKKQMLQALSQNTPPSDPHNLPISAPKLSRPSPHRSKYPSQISLQQSDISLLSLPNYKNYLENPILREKVFNKLQNQVREEILTLREDKITLKEEYNRVLGRRWEVQREVGLVKSKIQRQKKKMEEQGQIQIEKIFEGKQQNLQYTSQQKQKQQEINSKKQKLSDLSIYDQLKLRSTTLTNFLQNQQAKRLLILRNIEEGDGNQGDDEAEEEQEKYEDKDKEMMREMLNDDKWKQYEKIITQTEKQSQQFMMSYIEKLQQSSRVLQKQINSLAVTQTDRFLPQQKQKYSNLKNTNPFESFLPQNNFRFSQTAVDQGPRTQLAKLQEYRSYLYRALADRIQSYNKRTYFYQTIHQNRELQTKLQKLNQRSSNNNNNQFLKEHIQQQQKAKQTFFEDLGRFKQQLKRIREENCQLRKKIGDFI